MKQVIATAKEKMGKTCDVYFKEMQSLRAGRANPRLLDKIMVDYYGSPTPINQLGNIAAPEPCGIPRRCPWWKKPSKRATWG